MPTVGHVLMCGRRPERCDLGLGARACFINDTGLGESRPASRSAQGTQVDMSLTTLPVASRVTNLLCSVRLRHVAQLAKCSTLKRRTASGPFTELTKSGIRTTSPLVLVS